MKLKRIDEFNKLDFKIWHKYANLWNPNASSHLVTLMTVKINPLGNGYKILESVCDKLNENW